MCPSSATLLSEKGPFPTKKGTEFERKQKREEDVARGNHDAPTSTVHGKHSQAREFIFKWIRVDVAPQMAFQFIKSRPKNLVISFFGWSDAQF